jgi:hypothetical protein
VSRFATMISKDLKIFQYTKNLQAIVIFQTSSP